MAIYARAAVCVVAASVAACTSAPPLQHTRSSKEDVARAVLEAVSRRETAALESLALSDAEFRAHVWPDLPASQPERNLPYSYVWMDLQQKSRAGLTQTLAAHGGRLYTLDAVRFGGRTDYRTYTVHRATTLVVRDTTGSQHDIRVFGSMIEKDGAWKVFSYVVDD